jgi:hypothetical protein
LAVAINAVAAAFGVERQVLTAELSRSVAESLLWRIEEKEKIAAGLLLCFSMAIGQRIGNVKIEKIERIYPPTRNQGTIDFKLICLRQDSLQVNLGICVLPFPNIDLVNAACNRLLVYKDFGLDRLSLLCQSNLIDDLRQLPVCLSRLLSKDIGGHPIRLEAISLTVVMTTLSVFQHKQQYGIASEMIFAYLLREKLLTENELITSILLAID